MQVQVKFVCFNGQFISYFPFSSSKIVKKIYFFFEKRWKTARFSEITINKIDFGVIAFPLQNPMSYMDFHIYTYKYL